VLHSNVAEQAHLSLTVYSNGRSMVRDRRNVSFEKGRFFLEIHDVSPKMRAETAQFKSSRDDTTFSVLEQNLEADLITPQQLLEKHVGKKVTVIRTHPTTGAETAESAEVVSARQHEGVVLKMANRIESGIPGRIVFSEVPANLRSEPTFRLLVDSSASGGQSVDLNYQTDGVSWKSDYVAELDDEEKATNLTGLVTLTNDSGTSFRNAHIQLMAGEVQQVSEPRMYTKYAMPAAASADAVPSSESASRESFFEYHLYTLPNPTSVLSKQTKQVTLLRAPQVKSRKELVFTSANYDFLSPLDDGDGASLRVGENEASDPDLGAPVPGIVSLVFDNDKDSKIGMPLPAGIVRVYKKDKSGTAQFIGEDTIRHTPEGERVRVGLGQSFDVTARRKRMSFEDTTTKLDADKRVRVGESTVRVRFKNAKSAAQKIVYREAFPGEWKLLSSTHEHKRLSKTNEEWQLVIPSKGEVTVNFRVQVKGRS